MATATVYSYTSTSVTFRVTGATSGGLVRIRFRKNDGTDDYLIYDISYQTSSSTFTKTFPSGASTNAYQIYTTNYYYQGGLVAINLTPNTAYIAEVLVKETTSTSSWTSLGTLTWTTSPEYTRDSIRTWSGSSLSAYVGAYKILTYRYTATASGTLTWSSSTTGVDTIGWIHSSSAFSVDSNGYPTSTNYYLVQGDDENGRAFSVSLSVTAGATYYLFVTCYAGGSGTVTLNVSLKSGVTPWDWAISNGDATAAETYEAYTLFSPGGQLKAAYNSDLREFELGINYKVWNDLVSKCNEVITARGGSWATDYGTLSATLMTESDKAMTAARFNAVWWQCSQYINTGMGAAAGGYCPVVAGSTAMNGSYFIDLANAVNNTIY